MLNAKNEIVNLVQGKTSVQESIHNVQTTVRETTQKTSTTFDNVIKYAQRTVDPSKAEEDRPEFDERQIELFVHELTNEQRTAHGLPKLMFDEEIASIARAHSLDMAQRKFFSHETPDGLDPTERADKAGFTCTKMVGILVYSGLAENIFQGYLYDSYFTVNNVVTSYNWLDDQKIAELAVNGWMESPGHRQNILTEMFDREGIGIIITDEDQVFITQNFC